MTAEPEVASPLPPPPPPRPDRHQQSGGDKELRPTGAAAGAAILAALAWTVWASTGSRLSLFLSMATITALAIDLVWSQVASNRVQITVTHAPTDAVVGDTVRVSLSLAGPRQFVRVALLSFAPTAQPAGVQVPASEDFLGLARTRQVLDEVLVEIVSHGLAGLVACARRRLVPLPRPMAVGPRPTTVDEPFPELFQLRGEGGARPASMGDIVRGVRPYAPGDPLRRVHWRASARVGDLVVKEVEDAGSPRLILVLNLGNGGMAAERAASRAAWYAEEALRREYDLVLATAEGSRLVVKPALSWQDLNRRLAAAAPPGQPNVDAQRGGVAGVLLVTPKGDSWL